MIELIKSLIDDAIIGVREPADVYVELKLLQKEIETGIETIKEDVFNFSKENPDDERFEIRAAANRLKYEYNNNWKDIQKEYKDSSKRLMLTTEDGELVGTAGYEEGSEILFIKKQKT